MKRLDGQVVLVTGASSGFGQAIALAYAAAGANLALNGRDEARLDQVAGAARAHGVQVLTQLGDVTDEATVVAATELATRELGPIDVLINNAGTNVRERRIQETSAEQWRDLLAVNLTAVFLFTRAVLPAMIARESGLIINVASHAAIHPTLASGVGYASSKMGVDALTRLTNEEGNPHNVRACLLCPGVGNTPLIDLRPNPPPAEQRPLMLQPEDIAEIAVFLATLPPRVNVEQIVLKPTRLA